MEAIQSLAKSSPATVRPRIKRAVSVPIDLCDMRSAVLVVYRQWARETEVCQRKSEAEDKSTSKLCCRTGRANQSVIDHVSSN